MASPKTVHEISTESLGTTVAKDASSSVETFLRSEVRHIKGKGYAFSCYLVSRDDRHPDVSIYQLTQSDGFAITPDAGRFSVVKLRDAVEQLTQSENREKMHECKARVRAMHTPGTTALVPVEPGPVAVIEPSEPSAVAAPVAVETPESYAAGMKLAREILARPEPEAVAKPSRKPRKARSKPTDGGTVAVIEAPVVVIESAATVAKPKKPGKPVPRKGEVWEDSKGERRRIVSVTPDDDNPDKLDIVWEESRPGVSYNYLAMSQLAAWRRWESKLGGKRT